MPINPSRPLLSLGKFNVSGIDVQFDWQVGLDDLNFGKGKVSLNTAVSYPSTSSRCRRCRGAATYDYAGTIGTNIETATGIAHPRWKSV